MLDSDPGQTLGALPLCACFLTCEMGLRELATYLGVVMIELLCRLVTGLVSVHSKLSIITSYFLNISITLNCEDLWR